MSEILSRCGYRCDLCLAYQPNIQAHPENAQLISDGWFKFFGFRVPPEKIKCPGCLSDADETLDIGCPVRPCVVARGLVNCAYCEAYVCEKLQERLVRFESMQEKSPEPISKLEWQLFILPYENQVRLVELRSRLGRKDD